MKHLNVMAIITVLVMTGNSCFAQENDRKGKPFSADNLVGKWVNYATEFIIKQKSRKSDIGSFSSIICNACPEIDFHPDSTGIIKSGGDSNQEPLVKFSWRSQNSTLYINNIISYPDYHSNYLIAGLYTITAKNDNSAKLYGQVILTDAKGTRYILTRKTVR